MQRWHDLSVVGAPIAHRVGNRLEVRYRSRPGVRDELVALAAAERECCAFVTWEVDADADAVVLRVVADPATPDDVAPIAALFGIL